MLIDTLELEIQELYRQGRRELVRSLIERQAAMTAVRTLPIPGLSAAINARRTRNAGRLSTGGLRHPPSMFAPPD